MEDDRSMPQSPTLAGLALPFLLALLLKRQALELPRVLGMPTRLSGPLRVTETFLQLGRLLMQLDRSGVRRQFPALGQRSSLTSAGRTLMLADLLGPTRCLTRSLEDATNLLNGLHSQVPKTLWRLVLGLFVPAHGCPTILGKPVNRVARSPSAWRVAAPPTTGLLPPPLGVAGRTRFGLLCRGGRSKHDGAAGG
jgi:hypothetical protein